MATPALIPMIAPDGTPGHVDASAVQQAASLGYKPALTMRSPDGTQGLVQFSDLKSATDSGYKTEGQYQQSKQPKTDAGPQGFIQSLVAPIPTMARGIYNNVMDDPKNPTEANVMGTNTQSGVVARALGHIGLGAYRTLVAPTVDSAKAAASSMHQGNYMQAASEAAQAIPLVGGVVGAGAQATGQAANGDYKGAAGTVLGNLLAGGMTDAMMHGVPEKGIDPVGVPETAARKITQAINPPTGAQNLVEAVVRHHGDIQDYIHANNLNVDGVLPYAKAAQGLADQTHTQYRSLLDPIGNKDVPVPNSLYEGNVARTGSATPRATLNDISARIAQINDLTGPANNLPTEAGSTAALARSKMMAEKSALGTILDNEIGNAHGIEPSDITALRQKIGSLNDISDLAQTAYTNRMKTTANIAQGTRTLPEGKMGVVQHVLNSVRGGPNGIADRAFVSAGRTGSIPASGAADALKRILQLSSGDIQ